MESDFTGGVSWIEAETKGAEFGDARLADRLSKL